MSNVWTRRFLVPLIGAAAFLSTQSSTGSVLAAPIDYQFSGLITSAEPATGLVPGDRFTGTFTYDPGASPVDVMRGPGTDQFDFNKQGLTLQVGNRSILDQPGLLVTTISGASTQARISEPAFGWVNGQAVHVNLDLTGSPVINSFLPPQLDMAMFSMAHLTAPDPNTGNVLFSGTIDSVSTVPEPTSAVLVVAAFALAGWHGRARRARPLASCPARSA